MLISDWLQVSVNQRDWEVVSDNTRLSCRSWQMITFPRRPVVFVRIVGTHNTANEVFHCVHFEAPANSGVEVMSTTVSHNNDHSDAVEIDVDDDNMQRQVQEPVQDPRQNQLQGLHDPLQFPLGLAAGGAAPPLLPLAPAVAQPMQGIDAGVARAPQQQQQQQQVAVAHNQIPGALPRSVRVRRDSASSSSQ